MKVIVIPRDSTDSIVNDDGVAGMFEELTPAHANAVVETLGSTFSKIFYPIVIQYNPVFILWTIRSGTSRRPG